MSDTLNRTLTRSLNRHPYSDTLNRPTSIGHVAATIPLAGNTQLPTNSAEEPKKPFAVGILTDQFAIAHDHAIASPISFPYLPLLRNPALIDYRIVVVIMSAGNQDRL